MVFVQLLQKEMKNYEFWGKKRVINETADIENLEVFTSVKASIKPICQKY